MAYYGGQYGQYAQSGYANQSYPQYNNYQNTAATAAQSNYRFSASTVTPSTPASTQSYGSQQYSYGYTATSNTTTSTTVTQGHSYQQFSSLWYAQSGSQNQQSQQSTVAQQQQQTNRTNQQMGQQVTYPQYYQQQQQSYQAMQQSGQQQYNKGTTAAKTASQTQQSRSASTGQTQPTGTSSNQQSDWSSQNQPRNDYYQIYGNQNKVSNTSNWSGNYGQQNKDWSSQTNQYNQQQVNSSKSNYQSSGTGGGGDYNYNQQSTIQHPPQIYQSQQRNYNQGQQQFGYGQGGNQRGSNMGDQYRGGHGSNQENRGGNWNSGGGQGNWNNQGNWGGSSGGGWGDWNGPRNNSRRGDDGPHIPPFPPAWHARNQSQPPMQPGGNRNEMKGWGPGNKWSQSWDVQGGGRQERNNSRFSRGDGPRNEKFNSTTREKSNRELWSPAETKRKEKPPKGKEETEKPIQANEIKAYLYAWLGMRRMRPHYDIHPVGERPDLTFRCELRVTGYKFVGVGEAISKKDAQTDAAWNFAEFLVKQNLLKRSELPPKSKSVEDSTEDFGTVKEYESEKARDAGRNRRSRNTSKTPVPLMSIVTAPMGNIPPFPAFERHPDSWGMPPHRRGGSWMEGPPGGPWRGGGPRSGRGGGWGRQREMEEPYWGEEEYQHPEDIFINRMIMNQKEAAMSSRRFEGRPGEWVSLAPARSRNVTTLDDRHVMGKHAAIYPREEELKSVHEMVTLVERALKALSDQFVDEDHPLPKEEEPAEEEEEQKKDEGEEGDEKKEEADDEKAKKTKIQILKRPKKRPRKVPDNRPRVLSAVNRVGTLAKGLLIHSDMSVSLVLLCGSIPTKSLLGRIMKHLPAKIDDINKDLKYDLIEQEAGFLIVGQLLTTVSLTITLTSTLLTSVKDKKERKDGKEEKKDDVKEEAGDNKETKTEGEVEQDSKEKDENEETEERKDADDVKKPEDIPDMLPEPLLLGALAELRHSKWFQQRASQQDWGVVITRILRDMKMKNQVWMPLTDWALENLVYVSLSSSTEHMSPGDALRRFFEVVAGGVLLEDRSGVLDPCERDDVDVLRCCTSQQLEDITRHAQHSLLKIAFRKVHEVLDMEKMTMLNPQQPGEYITPGSKIATQEDDEKEGARKRRLEHNSSDSLAESPKRSLTDEEGDADTQQNLAELSISDQIKASLGAAAAAGNAASPELTAPDVQSNQDEELMETDN